MNLSAPPLTKLKINKHSCVKYLKFLFYLRKYNLGKEWNEWNKWNRYDTCLFRNEEKKTSIKMVLSNSLMNWRNLEKEKEKEKKKEKNEKEIRENTTEEMEMKKEKTALENYLAFLMSKPISIASFDLDGTLMDHHSNNYENKVLYDKHIFNSLQNLKNNYKRFVIFSNQTNVSSARDYKHLQFQKLPNLSIKIKNFQNFVNYFFSRRYQSAIFNTHVKTSVNSLLSKKLTQKKNSSYTDMNIVSTEWTGTKKNDKISASSNTRIDCGVVRVSGHILCVRFVETYYNSFNIPLPLSGPLSGLLPWHFRFHFHLNLRKCVERNNSYLRKKFRLGCFYKMKKEKFHFFFKKYIRNKNNGSISSPTKRKLKKEMNKNRCKLHKIVLTNNKRKIHFDFYLAIGKWGLKEIDMFPKPEIGLFALFICLEAIKQFLIWNCYFKNSQIQIKQKRETKEKNISRKDYLDYLECFLKIYEEIFSIKKIKLLTHNMKRKYLSLDNLALQILNIYINEILKNSTYFKEIEKQNIDMEIIRLFLNDHISFPLSKIQETKTDKRKKEQKKEQKQEKEIMEFLENTENLKYFIPLLIYKNEIMKKLMKKSIPLFFNSQGSFYMGNNIGRDFDKSDTDLMFARKVGITCIDQLR